MISSPLERALQTAMGVFPEPPGGCILAREEVREVMFGPSLQAALLAAMTPEDRAAVQDPSTLLPGNNSQRFSVSSKRDRFGDAVDFRHIE